MFTGKKMRQAQVHKLPMTGPNDVSQIKQLIDTGQINASDIIAILGKTEGNGCVNDFTRGFAVQSLHNLLLAYVNETALRKIGVTISGGTEGGLSPHWLVFTASNKGTQKLKPNNQKSLAFGTAVTQIIEPWKLGRVGQIEAVEKAVKFAMQEAGITDPNDVYFVQVKCPLLTSEQISKSYDGKRTATNDTLKSMGLSRGASALGVAVALDEISIEELSDSVICNDYSYFSTKASCSAGVELDHCEILVMGMSTNWIGDLVVNYGVMQDAIDIEPLMCILAPIRTSSKFQLQDKEQESILAVLAKAEASTSGHIRDHRHTMLNDSDISSTRHARGFTGGAIAAVMGHTSLFISGGAEHQGPDGGGPIAAIYRIT